MTNSDVVNAVMRAYREQDRESAARLIAAEYTFTSPQDDHIDRSAYFQRCFPTANRFVQQRILQTIESDREHVFLLYQYTLADGTTYRNTEYVTIRNGQLVETQVFFGGQYPAT